MGMGNKHPALQNPALVGGYPENPPDTAGSLIARLRARRVQVEHNAEQAHVAVRELAAEAVVLDRLIKAAESPA